MLKRYNQLFSDNPPGKTPRLRLGYGTEKRAQNSINKLKTQDKAYQKQAATTMYYRAKYHKYQTKGMRNAMRVYGKFLQTLKQTKKK